MNILQLEKMNMSSFSTSSIVHAMGSLSAKTHIGSDSLVGSNSH